MDSVAFVGCVGIMCTTALAIAGHDQDAGCFAFLTLAWFGLAFAAASNDEPDE